MRFIMFIVIALRKDIKFIIEIIIEHYVHVFMISTASQNLKNKQRKSKNKQHLIFVFMFNLFKLNTSLALKTLFNYYMNC